MTTEGGHRHTHLFTVRVWLEEVEHGRVEWRGRVEHVMSGERRYFQGWPGLLEQLKGFLPGSDESARTGGPGN